MCLEKIALLLQTIGFFTTAVLVGVIKWDVLKPTLDRIKSIICETPIKLKGLQQYLSSTVAKLFLRIIFRFSKFEKEEPDTIVIVSNMPNVITEYVLYPLYIILCSFISVPIFIVAFFAKFLSGHKRMTNILLVFGTMMLFAGLLMELIFNW